MARRASNADRIARAAAEAEATAKEKAAKRTSGTGRSAPPRKRSRAAAGAKVRMKVIWAVGKPGLVPVKTFPYKEKEAAEKESERRGGEFMVMPLKVPME